MDSLNNAISTLLSSSWLPHSIGVPVLSLAVLYVVIRAIYNLAFSPLSSVPGPWYAAVSNFWIMTHILRLQQCKTVQSLFEDYGPVVRIAPNKVVFRDITTMRSVYSVHKFDKSPFYKSLLTNDNDHAMTTLDHAGHVVRRKGYAPHYIPANLARFQTEAHDITLELLNGIDQMSSKPSINCLSLFRHFMTDIIVSSLYGCRLGALNKWIVGAEDPLTTAIGDFPRRGILRSAVPSCAWKFICRLPNSRWRHMCNSDKIMAEFVSARVYETRAQMDSGKMGESENIPMLHRLLGYMYTPNESMPDQDIISEAMGHLIAGTDTMSTSLSYFCWELSRRADIMKKLQAELDQVIPDSRTIPDISVLQRLPYLNAFLKEGLRLYSAAPSVLERVVPSSTSKNGATNEPFDLMGYALPPGTVVSTQGWSMHRDTSVFPSPETFLPDRWLETSSNSEHLAHMAQYLMPFGTGSRVCGGQNLAQMMLRIAIATLARNYDIVAPPETNERSMEIKDSFVIFPVSMECKLTFKPRQL